MTFARNSAESGKGRTAWYAPRFLRPLERTHPSEAVFGYQSQKGPLNIKKRTVQVARGALWTHKG